jgi:hypothetical protein
VPQLTCSFCDYAALGVRPEFGARELLDAAARRRFAIPLSQPAANASPENNHANKASIDETGHEPVAKLISHSVVVHQERQYEEKGVQHVRIPP